MSSRSSTSTADLAAGTDAPEEHDQTADDRRELEPLLSDVDGDDFRQRWSELQTSFVDDPQRVVKEADSLVAELMQRLAQTFATEREGLESQWSRGDDVSTEDLRVALQRYRSFFERLLAT
jgi:hypothetical protein